MKLMRTQIPRAALVLLSLALVVANGMLFAHLFFVPQTQMLKVSFLDVGQGDAILIETPSGVQMLIDGGKDRSAVRELPKVMGPLDRSIDVVVATHPDADHIGGLPEVLSGYRVDTIIVSGKDADTPQASRFTAFSEREQALQVTAQKGMRIHLGDGVYADVLHPEANVAQLRETNDASLSMRLVYKETEFLFTGDAPMWVEERIVSAYGDTLRSDVLKAGHHGSRTSTGEALINASDPSFVVVSAGKNNSYGHPHPEVLARVAARGIPVVSTIDRGTVTFVSDGTNLSLR